MGGRLGPVLVLVAFFVAGCGGGSGPVPLGRIAPGQPVAVSKQKETWSPCGGGFWCRTLSVPLDYENPGGRQISLALIRRPATDRAHRIGSVLFNPGGPGESGIQFLRDAVDSFTHLNQRLDLVSWDTRGVGDSTPVMCLDGPHLDAYFAVDAVLDDPQEKAAYIQADKDFAAGCKSHSGYLLPFMDSESTARDMDQIRKALGDSKLTFFGMLYGTFIGQWYAHLFPTQVRALAFDGVVDSKARGPSLGTGGAEAFQRSLDAFFATCKSRSSCTFGGSGDGEKKLEALMARVDTTPLPVGNRQLTRNLAMTAILSSMYDEGSWPDLDDALVAADRGDGSKLLDIADSWNERNPDGTYSNLLNGGADATTCLDSATVTDIAEYDRLGPELARISPLFGPWEQYQDILCAYWPVGTKNLYVSLTITGAPPILLVGATGDPATPYGEAVTVNKQIPGSVLLTREGNGHTSYFDSQCIVDAVDAYLTDLQLPPTGKVCR